MDYKVDVQLGKKYFFLKNHHIKSVCLDEFFQYGWDLLLIRQLMSDNSTEKVNKQLTLMVKNVNKQLIIYLAAKHRRVRYWSGLILQSEMSLSMSKGRWPLLFRASIWAPCSSRVSTICKQNIQFKTRVTRYNFSKIAKKMSKIAQKCFKISKMTKIC